MYKELDEREVSTVRHHNGMYKGMTKEKVMVYVKTDVRFSPMFIKVDDEYHKLTMNQLGLVYDIRTYDEEEGDG
jgi:hypothetical protein